MERSELNGNVILDSPVMRILCYFLIAAVSLLAIYVFLAGGQLIGKLDAFY